MAITRLLLKSMCVAGKFWWEAVRHAVYLLNRLPIKAMDDRTPFKAWSGKKPHLAHIRVFDCMAHAKVTVPHVKKLDDRSQSMVYFGVEEGSKAHRLLDPHRCKSHVNHDVIFEENVEWKWSVGTEGAWSPDFVIEEEANPVQGSLAPFVGSSTSQPVPTKEFSSTTPTTPPFDRVPAAKAASVGGSVSLSSTLTSLPTTPQVVPTTRTMAEEHADQGEDLPTPWSGGHVRSDDGVIKYRHIDDIMRDAPHMDLA